MRLPHSVLALPLLLACTTAQGESPNATPQSDATAPVQLAQYPGAPLEDRAGNLWFATVEEGLIRYDGAEFVTFTTKDGLAGNSIRDIVELEDGTLWIATTGGLSVFDGASFKTLTDYSDWPVTRTFSHTGFHRDLWDILQDKHGDLWIATMDGVFRFDGATFVPFPLPVVATAPNFEFTPKMVYSMFEDRTGRLWFGTDGAGAVCFDGTDMTVYTEKEHGLCSDRVCAILEDSRGDFWFGTSSGGVSRYDGTTFTTHLRSATFSEHTGWGRYMAIHEDRAGDVWFGASMAGGGVHRFDGKTFQYFGQEHGLGTGGVPSIREDRSGNLWFGTTSGVYRLEGERFVNFTKSE